MVAAPAIWAGEQNPAYRPPPAAAVCAASRQLEVRLQSQKRFDPRLVSFRNYYVSGAHEYQLDGQGRILIPQHLREYAGLKRDVVFTGDIEKFRIWEKDAWQQVFATD